MSWSADHTNSWLLGSNAAAAGTRGKPIIGPHLPTIAGFVLKACALSVIAANTEVTCGAPRKRISAAATDEPPAALDRAVSLTKRVITGKMPTLLTGVLSAQVPVATGVPKWTPSELTLIANRPIAPAARRPWRGS